MREWERGLRHLWWMIPKAAERGRQQAMRAGFASGLLAAGAMLSLAALGVGTRVPSPLSLLSMMSAPMPPVAILIAIHFGYGSFAGSLYAAQAHRPSTWGGAIFGVALWLVAILVYAPMLGLGFGAIRVPLLALLALPPHLVFGVLVGYLIAVPKPAPAVDPARPAPSGQTSSSSLRAAASAPRARSLPPSRLTSRSRVR